jgi:hypothetical protein
MTVPTSRLDVLPLAQSRDEDAIEMARDVTFIADERA